ncbi:MAG: hypothetical protein ACK4N5_08365, partial [Myxococcales bacterium]
MRKLLLALALLGGGCDFTGTEAIGACLGRSLGEGIGSGLGDELSDTFGASDVARVLTDEDGREVVVIRTDHQQGDLVLVFEGPVTSGALPRELGP